MRKLTLMLLLVATAAQAQQSAVEKRSAQAQGSALAQQSTPLTVEKIMQDQKWIGIPPSNYRWSDDSKSVYFDWNPDNKPKGALYSVNVSNKKVVKAVDSTGDKLLGAPLIYNRTNTLAVAEKDGDIYLLRGKGNTLLRLTNTLDREGNVAFLYDNDVVFQRGDNLFQIDLKTNELKQLTNFVKGKKPVENKSLSPQDAWLKKEQRALFDVVRKQDSLETLQKSNDRISSRKKPKPIYLEDQYLSNLAVSPDGRYVTYQLVKTATGSTRSIVPDYVTASGYTEDIPGRTKVGEPMATYHNYIYDKQRDSVYGFQPEQIPGIKDLPDYLIDYPKELEARKKKNEDRNVSFTAVIWNSNASLAVVVAESLDNKDRWILKLDASSGKLSIVDRQRDEAWVGGPGINSYDSNIGWLDNHKIYYQSEASGYSHVYVSDVSTGEKHQLTSGKWEVQTLQLSKDKKTFYFTANKEHPGLTHFYKMSTSGTPMQITSMKGGNQVTLSPDEKWLAINYSYMNKPWELYVQPNKPGAKAVQITHSTSAAFDAYDWRKPDMISFKNRDGVDVYARVYPAKNPGPNHPAVVFVHGAGYLQNVHFWWSTYSREYMFNNMLADQGYTVIDIDYTGSSGYGRDFRTGIYRHMGGKDLSDQVDGVKLLVEKYGVDPKHVGIYGGSYGGFITLMALFKEQNVFASGAALRSVTDWAHYNHGYTSNILNEPFADELAYQRSSPINFAAGLKGNLLMCHGMVDVNVHFQDIVRLSQRLIELGKNHWELAVYPVESHGFTEPSSWTDEYKRIFKLFETTLK
jgi:dipeptidyl aminopeptidase/acylaminoacyl peptidase